MLIVALVTPKKVAWMCDFILQEPKVFSVMKTAFLAGNLLLFGSTAASLLAQGSLAPVAAPTPTMKRLDQIEARTEINSVNTPATGSASFKITKPGSYYLTGNLPRGSGIVRSGRFMALENGARPDISRLET